MLAKLNIFEVLMNGDGYKLHPLSRSWGRENNHFTIKLELEEGFSLAARLR